MLARGWLEGGSGVNHYGNKTQFLRYSRSTLGESEARLSYRHNENREPSDEISSYPVDSLV